MKNVDRWWELKMAVMENDACYDRAVWTLEDPTQDSLNDPHESDRSADIEPQPDSDTGGDGQ